MLRAHDAVRTRKLRHQQPTATLVPDKPPEDGVRHSRHRREYCRRTYGDRPNRKASRKVQVPILTGPYVSHSGELSMEPSSLVKVTGAFAAGVVLALGGALIY